MYDGIGDDRLEGGPGNDWLSGGFGSDAIDGQEGDDFVRGDGTIDHIFDTGGGFDTLSFATRGTPGFGAGKAPAVTGFPKGEEAERGVFVNLAAGGQNAEDGIAASGGGVDEVQPGAFERIVGSPFSDYLVGTGASEEIIGGGGADVILGGGGQDVLRGGADGDFLEVAPGSNSTSDTGADLLHGGSGDDALIHNGGADYLDGGEGSDLFGTAGVDARIDLGLVGEVGPNEAPVCPGETFDHLTGIEDLEGSEGSDVLFGGEGDNQLLGHRGEDTYRALGGNDTIFRQLRYPRSGHRLRRRGRHRGRRSPPVVDPAPIGCERVRGGTPNEFETEIEQPVLAPVTLPPPAPAPVPSAPVTKPKPDRIAPRTKLLRRPAKVLHVR
ncbi:MAG: hypothetical protein JST53_12915 [Actinobacteria bacterium]|nr:hypothetical protein [Actinomycetota bacterium]